MLRIKFEKAKQLFEWEFDNPLPDWPEWFPPVMLAALQSPLRNSDTRAWEAAIESAVTNGELASTPQMYFWHSPSKFFDDDLNDRGSAQSYPTVTARDFAVWLTAQNETPSELIAAWFEAMRVNSKTEAAPSENGKKWTKGKLEELAEYRSGHTMIETASKFGITEQRIRQLLPRKKSKANPYAGLIHRTK